MLFMFFFVNKLCLGSVTNFSNRVTRVPTPAERFG